MARRLRCFEEGRDYEITDRTLGELHRFLPTPIVVAIVSFAIKAAMALVPEVGVLQFTVMGNHWHLILRSGRDAAGIPKFMQMLKSLVAREINAHLGRRGFVWAKRYTAIPIRDLSSLLRRQVYLVMNPAAAGLCARFEEWPGVSTSLQLLGLAPKFDIPLQLPREWEGLDAATIAAHRAALLETVRAEEAALAEDRRRRGLPRPQVAKILKRMRHDDRPDRPKRGPQPICFAATPAARDAFRSQVKAFEVAFRAASDAFRRGALDAVFPPRALPPRLMRPPVEAPG